jgi:hypothetical protein
MEITIEELIAGLTKNHALTDSIVVTWWSKDDVNLLLDEPVSDSQAEELWDAVCETFGNDLDSVIERGNDTLTALLKDQSKTN